MPGETRNEPADEFPLEPKPKIATKREGRCRVCASEVYWAVTEANRRPIPLNPVPSTDPARGNFIGVNLPSGEHVMRYIGDATRAEIIAIGGAVWESHFAKCEGRRRTR